MLLRWGRMLTKKRANHLVLVGVLSTLLGSCPALVAQSAQTDGAPLTRPIAEVQLGSTQGLGFKFPHLALGARIERPIASRFEADAEAIYSPDREFGFSSGHQITAEANGIYWAKPGIGLFGGYEHDWLVTPRFRKSVSIPAPGVVFRGGREFPWRLYLRWLVPADQYDPKTGIEPSRLTGPDVLYEFQLYEHLRFGLLLGIYHGYEQGNPACDGNAANPQHLPVCPRTGYTSGQASLIFRFTRKQSLDAAY